MPLMGAPEPAESGVNAKASVPAPAVFISYASQDTAVANSIVESIEQQGLRCWLAPRDVRPGAQYADAIVRAINEAKVVVLVLSASAIGSDHVAREVERAASKRKPIIAFRIDSAALNPGLEYFLSNSQWIDVPATGMQAALAKLAEAAGRGSAHMVAADSEASTKPLERTAGRAKLIAGAALIISVGVGVALTVHFWSKSHRAASATAAVAITEKSIAVLPFTDLSEKKDQEYFADGMAEEILNLLVNVPGLKVIGRTSSFQFKGKAVDLRNIGAALGAAYVVEGSVRKSTEHVRVTAQLINTQDGAHAWSQTYDRDVSDVLKVQDEIAAGLVRALQIEVEMSQLRIRPQSAEAYDYYLRGLHSADQYNEQGLNAASANFRRALELDPSFSPAAEALASTLFAQADFEFAPAQTGFPQARAAAEAALKLNPNSTSAHATLGAVHLQYDWDWPAAERELSIARQLSPNTSEVLLGSAQERLAVGQWDEAARLVDAAIAGDPLNAGAHQVRLWVYLRLGQFAEAEKSGQRELEISPTYAYGHYFLGMVKLAEGNLEAALAEMQREPTPDGRDTGLVVVYQAMQRRRDAEAALARLEDEHHFLGALIYAYAALGLNDKAFEALDTAYAQKFSELCYIKGHPFVKPLEHDPRFKAFLRKMNLPE